MLRPRIRLPLWAFLAIAATGYLARGYLWRGGDMSPDLPSDAVVLVALIVVVAATWTLRVRSAREKREENEAREERQEHTA